MAPGMEIVNFIKDKAVEFLVQSCQKIGQHGRKHADGNLPDDTLIQILIADYKKNDHCSNRKIQGYFPPGVSEAGVLVQIISVAKMIHQKMKRNCYKRYKPQIGDIFTDSSTDERMGCENHSLNKPRNKFQETNNNQNSIINNQKFGI